MGTGGEKMNTWKMRLILIGFINAVLAVIVGVLRGFSLPLIGLVCVGMLLIIVGIAWNPKEEADST